MTAHSRNPLCRELPPHTHVRTCTRTGGSPYSVIGQHCVQRPPVRKAPVGSCQVQSTPRLRPLCETASLVGARCPQALTAVAANCIASKLPCAPAGLALERGPRSQCLLAWKETCWWKAGIRGQRTGAWHMSRRPGNILDTPM